MRREIVLGDYVLGAGMIVCIISSIVLCAVYMASCKSTFNLVALGMFVLILLSFVPLAVFLLTLNNDEFIRYQYLYPLFVLFLKFADVGVLSNTVYSATVKFNSTAIFGIDLFLILGVITIMVGAYITQLQSTKYKPVIGPDDISVAGSGEQSDKDKSKDDGITQ